MNFTGDIMACFLVPTIIGGVVHHHKDKFSDRLHINWLTAMIWGGAVGLAIEHIAHQEIVPWFPFLTAMGNPADFIAMLREMAMVGIPMTIALVAVWAIMVVVYEKFIVKNKFSFKTTA